MAGTEPYMAAIDAATEGLGVVCDRLDADALKDRFPFLALPDGYNTPTEFSIDLEFANGAVLNVNHHYRRESDNVDFGNGIRAKDDVQMAIDRSFKEHGINIPFPHREIIMKTPVTVAPTEPQA